jgi:DNA-directed RNA polymerase specialized sigma24 family protein
MPEAPLDLAQLRAVIDRVVRTLDSHADPEHAYAAATAAGLLGRDLIDAAAAARGRALIAIRETEGLSIGQLADRMKMSKTRVQQLMHHAEERPR